MWECQLQSAKEAEFRRVQLEPFLKACNNTYLLAASMHENAPNCKRNPSFVTFSIMSPPGTADCKAASCKPFPPSSISQVSTHTTLLQQRVAWRIQAWGQKALRRVSTFREGLDHRCYQQPMTEPLDLVSFNCLPRRLISISSASMGRCSCLKMFKE